MGSSRIHKILLWLIPCAALPNASGFISVGRPVTTISLKSSNTSDDTGVRNLLGGVGDFEEWFSSNSSSGSQVNNVRHAIFNSMGRGLQFTSTKSSDLSKVAVVPRKLVLNVPFSDEEDSPNGLSWDTNLSCKLWEECQKGKDSVVYGYVWMVFVRNILWPYRASIPYPFLTKCSDDAH